MVDEVLLLVASDTSYGPIYIYIYIYIYVPVQLRSLWPVWFLFFKTVFRSQKKENEENMENTFSSQLFFVLKNTKNIENTKFGEQ